MRRQRRAQERLVFLDGSARWIRSRQFRGRRRRRARGLARRVAVAARGIRTEAVWTEASRAVSRARAFGATACIGPPASNRGDRVPWKNRRRRLSFGIGRPGRDWPRACECHGEPGSSCIRVLLIAKSFSKGGAAAGAANLLEALEAVDLEVLRLDAHEAQALSWRGAARLFERLVERSLYGPETHCLRLAPPAFDLRALVARYRPDVVQLCDVSGNVLRLADLAGLACPVVHRMSDCWPYLGPAHYGIRPDAAPWSARWLMRRTVLGGARPPSVRVAPSQWLANVVAGAGGGSPIRVIRNSVSVRAVPRRAGPRAGAIRFGFIARQIANPRKGLSALTPALGHLARRQSRVSLHLYGQSNPGAVPAIPGVEVIQHGSFERRDIDRVYDNIDILLCPSRLDNSPNVVTEALAHGRPVIAQSGTGMDSYVDATRGALVDFHAEPRRAADAFLAACAALVSNYAAVSQRAAAYARAELAPEIIGNAYRTLYRELVAPRARRCH